MTDLPFKPGDRIRHKNVTCDVRTVLMVHESGDCILVEDRNNVWDTLEYLDGWELVPDPMVARREAYIEWYHACYPDNSEEYRKAFKEKALSGYYDVAINAMYDAIVKTKHLFV